jgi:hypothetical protein
MGMTKSIFIFITCLFFSCNEVDHKRKNTAQSDNSSPETHNLTETKSHFGLGLKKPDPLTDSLGILESRIDYNDDFKPILFIRLKNNMKKRGIVAVKIIVIPEPWQGFKSNYSTKCEKIELRKKIVIAPNKSVIIRQHIRDGYSCNFKWPKIYVEDIIFKNGEKTSAAQLNNDIFTY